MTGEFVAQLSNGNKVVLANWEHYAPTEHGQKLREKDWTESNSRQQLGFYDATTEYMRNAWAFRNMDTVYAKVGGKGVVLFHSPETGQWHTTDALDIDHKTPWKEHLTKLDAKTMADAHMGYNDIANLRMLPSVFNRGRDSAENLLQKHGHDSPQWQQWVEKRLMFDDTMQIRDFDPERDGARRTKTTLNQVWDEDNKRSELKFDKQVVGAWFENELRRLHAGNVQITSPDGNKTWNVPLFRCTATGQLVTRDAFDIDHVVPYEQLNKQMLEMNGGSISKADALDAYNNTSNLRLVGRSANSSHEWEIGLTGQYRDKVEPKEKGEFDDFLKGGKKLDPQVAELLKENLMKARIVQEYTAEQYWRQSHVQGLQPPQQNVPFQNPVPVGPLLSDPRHPDQPMYAKILGDVIKHDPGNKLSGDQRQTLASSMVVMAKHMELDGVDRVYFKSIQDKPSIVMERGSRVEWLSVDEALKNNSLSRNTGMVELHAHHQKVIEERMAQMQQTGPQTVNVQMLPQQQGMHPLSGLPSQQNAPQNMQPQGTQSQGTQPQTGNTPNKLHF